MKDIHLGFSQDSRFQNRGTLYDHRASLIELPNQFSDSEKSTFLHLKIENRAAAIQAETTGIRVQLVPKHASIESRRCT